MQQPDSKVNVTRLLIKGQQCLFYGIMSCPVHNIVIHCKVKQSVMYKTQSPTSKVKITVEGQR
jgi:hypothetical protein